MRFGGGGNSGSVLFPASSAGCPHPVVRHTAKVYNMLSESSCVLRSRLRRSRASLISHSYSFSVFSCLIFLLTPPPSDMVKLNVCSVFVAIEVEAFIASSPAAWSHGSILVRSPAALSLLPSPAANCREWAFFFSLGNENKQQYIRGCGMYPQFNLRS